MFLVDPFRLGWAGAVGEFELGMEFSSSARASVRERGRWQDLGGLLMGEACAHDGAR